MKCLHRGLPYVLWACLFLSPLVEGAHIDEAFLRARTDDAAQKSEENREEWVLRVANAGRQIAVAAHEAYSKTLPKSDTLFLRPGLVADRETGSLTLWGWSAGMKESEPVEFFVITVGSGHDYETIVVTEAKPSDVDAALRFLGLTPGHPVDFRSHRFYPRGPRLTQEIAVMLPAEGGSGEMALKRTSMEHYVMQAGNQNQIPEAGVVFTGSVRAPDPQEEGVMVYAADVFAPKAIISNFNVAETVLETPRQARKEDVYGTQLARPDTLLPGGHPMQVILRRHAASAPHPEPALHMTVGWKDGAPLYRLEGEAVPVQEVAALADFVPTLSPLRDGTYGYGPFISVGLSPELSIVQAHRCARELADFYNTGPLGMDPPPATSLYWESFNPREDLRNRENRLFQPRELYLKKGEAGLSARLTLLDEVWKEGAIDPDIVETHLPAENREALARLVAQHPDPRGVLLIFAPGDITTGALHDFIAPVKDRFWVVFVYRLDLPAPE